MVVDNRDFHILVRTADLPVFEFVPQIYGDAQSFSGAVADAQPTLPIHLMVLSHFWYHSKKLLNNVGQFG